MNGGSNWTSPPHLFPGKTALKKPSRIRVNIIHKKIWENQRRIVFTFCLWNNTYLVLSVFRDNLLAQNQSFKWLTSAFIILNNSLIQFSLDFFDQQQPGGDESSSLSKIWSARWINKTNYHFSSIRRRIFSYLES